MAKAPERLTINLSASTEQFEADIERATKIAAEFRESAEKPIQLGSENSLVQRFDLIIGLLERIERQLVKTRRDTFIQ